MCGELIGVINKIACDKRKEICGFWPRIVPFDPAFALCAWIAIGQKDRQLAFNPYGKASHNIGAVWIKGNLAKALGFALGAEVAGGFVEALELGVFLGLDRRGDLELEGNGGRGGDGETFGGENVVGGICLLYTSPSPRDS